MSRDYWKLEEDLCRCCHSEGTFQNLAGAYNFDDEEEIYFNMLRETFDLNITPVSGSLCAATYTICDACITRLRDASSFKRQVIRCEQKFHQMYGGDFIRIAESDCKVEVKVEGPERDTENAEEFTQVVDEFADSLDSAHGDYHDDDDGESNTKTLKQDGKKKVKKTPQKAKTKAKPKKPPKKCGRPRKVQEVQHEGAAADDKADDSSEKPVTSKLEQLLTQGKRQVDDYVTEIAGADKKYVCRACEISYSRIHDLRYHVIRSHLKQKFIKCSLCPETFMYHSQRKLHMYENHLTDKPDQFCCGHCQRQFRRKNTLAEHMMDVHIQKKCKYCDLKFPRKKYLFHMNEEHGVPMPTCGVCGLRALMESALVRHQRNVHLNEKNKKCDICRKRFHTISNLKDHMITHNQDRIFKCDVCEKSFARKECFKAHYRIHTGERPFSCKICKAAFIQRASLRFHMKSHPEPRLEIINIREKK
ncbi:zinc finger and SCAN domain-containing protein 12-like isoform X1 [Manduca sexta]|uniref:zinc finger and SCAN domain-containing protein 12-like isoform X1 n=1 Tax=Manduca sexta TaxID=7130 RepID=UPI00188E86F0|nr:zinc finger and SCAN domain-containing protein 12-like isoform X1 [Manduca sexta]